MRKRKRERKGEERFNENKVSKYGVAVKNTSLINKSPSLVAATYAASAISIAIATRQLRLYANARGFRRTTFCTFRALDPLPYGEKIAAAAPRSHCTRWLVALSIPSSLLETKSINRGTRTHGDVISRWFNTRAELETYLWELVINTFDADGGRRRG